MSELKCPIAGGLDNPITFGNVRLWVLHLPFDCELEKIRSVCQFLLNSYPFHSLTVFSSHDGGQVWAFYNPFTDYRILKAFYRTTPYLDDAWRKKFSGLHNPKKIDTIRVFGKWRGDIIHSEDIMGTGVIHPVGPLSAEKVKTFGDSLRRHVAQLHKVQVHTTLDEVGYE